MTTLIVADPWLFEHDFEHAADRTRVLNQLFDVVDARPQDLELVPILDVAWWERRRTADRRTYQTGRTASRLAQLVRTDDATVCTITCSPAAPADVPLAWYRSVQEVLDTQDTTRWRDPVVLIPLARREQWPQTPEIAFCIDGRPVAERVLAVIEALDDHPHLLHDLDPWRCEDTIERRATDQCPRILPRPSCVDAFAITSWRTRLDTVPEHGRDGDRLYFIPPRDWVPDRIPKLEWRRGPFGERSTKRVGPHYKKGPKDHEGRTWAWDEAERHHWDVQDAHERSTGYLNVYPDGTVRP